MDEKTEFLLKRAREEATRAINADSAGASEAHQELAIRYSAKALVQLTNEDPEPVSGPGPKANPV
jgi:hypothetical protein